jgi:hypothetical protein
MRSDVVGMWQHHDDGLLSSDQMLRFEEDGTFSYHSTDTIVGLQMTGKWKLEDDRLRLFIGEVKVRGKSESVPAEWSKGVLTQPLKRCGRRFVLQLEKDRDFERTASGADK